MKYKVRGLSADQACEVSTLPKRFCISLYRCAKTHYPVKIDEHFIRIGVYSVKNQKIFYNYIICSLKLLKNHLISSQKFL